MLFILDALLSVTTLGKLVLVDMGMKYVSRVKLLQVKSVRTTPHNDILAKSVYLGLGLAFVESCSAFLVRLSLL